MSVEPITDRKNWYTEDTAQGKVEFLQSWDYSKILKEAGRDILRLSDTEDEFLQAVCVVNKTKFGKYAYIPRVYVSKTGIEKLAAYFKEQGFFAVRFETTNDCRPDGVRTVENAQPEHSWLLDVTPPIETLLANMHQKTRYNINVAKRKGVRIEQKKDLEIAWKLNQITTERNEYKNNPKPFFEVLLKSDMTEQFTAYVENEPIATAILLRYQDTMVYLFGASANDGRSTMAPNLLQWHMIQYAKSVGCRYYDFLGVATPKDKESREEVRCFHHYCWDPNHPYNGVSRFKAGYNGFVKSYPKAFDVILNRWRYSLFEMQGKLFRH